MIMNLFILFTQISIHVINQGLTYFGLTTVNSKQIVNNFIEKISMSESIVRNILRALVNVPGFLRQ